MAKTLIERIENLVMRDPNSGCWLWTGTLGEKGYGQIDIEDKTRRAHRVTYELFKGPILPGLEPDHKCRTRACVNPDHLEPVTHRENVMRGTGPKLLAERSRKRYAAISACPHGHAYTPENTQIYQRKDGYTNRICRTCHNARYIKKQP